MSANPYETHRPPKGGLYLKLDPGQTVTLRLATEPYVFQSEYQGNWSTRYAWVVYNHDEEVAQVLQLSPTTYRTIAAYALDADYGDPTEYNIKLTRNGSGTDTTYSVIPSPKKVPLTAEQKALVDKIDITSVKGLEHALPISQLQDAKDAPRPPSGDVVLTDLPGDDKVDPNEIPF